MDKEFILDQTVRLKKVNGKMEKELDGSMNEIFKIHFLF